LRPELLCPAGNMERLITCLTYGADAVYIGAQGFSLRAKGANFSLNKIKEAVSLVHLYGKRIYLCLNAYLYDHQIKGFEDFLKQLEDVPVDAIIAADIGVISIIKKHLPKIPIHLSTQANTCNSYSVSFWKEMGIKRINLARELNLNNIKSIRKNNPEIELETFIHGAMCLAISGRCYLSAYLNNRSANQGLCTHPCRFLYKIRGIAVEEQQRPDKILWEYFEDEPFSAFFSTEDLCLIKYLKWFIVNKIDSLKIEGRMKTSSYLGPVVDTYATAINDVLNKRFRLDKYIKELSSATTRICNTGFFLPNRRVAVLTPSKQKNPIVFKVIKKISSNKYMISVRHKVDCSADLEILVPGLVRVKISANTYSFEDMEGNILKEVNSGIECYFRYDTDMLKENYLVRGYL